MRILVCGDRNWTDKDLIGSVINQFSNVECVIEGEASGADSLAREVAYDLGIRVLKFPALWHLHGKAAGPIRNQQMLDEGKPDWVVAFHDDIDRSNGTRDMLNRAIKAGISKLLVSHNGATL